MKKNTYELEAEKLATVIDIAIDAFQTYPPHYYQKEAIDHIINVYKKWKNEALFLSLA